MNFLRKAVFAVASLALVAAIAWTGIWVYAAWRLPDQIAAQAAELRRQGYEIRWADLEVGGYPDSLVATMGEVALTAQSPWPETRLQAPELELRMAVLDWTRIVGRLREGLTVRGPTLSLSAESGEAVASLSSDRDTLRLDAALEGLTATGALLPDGAAARRVTLTAERPVRGAGDHTEAALAATLTATDLTLPAGSGGALGDSVAELAAGLRVMGEIPRAPMPDALVLWRDDGGTLEVDRLDLAWGPATLRAEGTLALDRALQPEGALTAEIGGHDAVLRALVAAGTITQRDAAGANLVFALLTRRPAEGGAPVLRVPLSVQDRLLRVGPIPLLPLPFLTWR